MDGDGDGVAQRASETSTTLLLEAKQSTWGILWGGDLAGAVQAPADTGLAHWAGAAADPNSGTDASLGDSCD